MDLRALPDWLNGHWAIERVINGSEGHFTGDAVFDPDRHGGARWHESGRLVIGGFDGPVSRTLQLDPIADGAGWQVRFDDGRPFHPLDLSSGRCEAEHLCGPDRYQGHFTVLDADRMTIRWRVTGPGRADNIDSEYRRSA